MKECRKGQPVTLDKETYLNQSFQRGTRSTAALGKIGT